MEEPTFACKIGQLPRVPVDYLRCRQFMDAVLLAGEVPGFAAATEDVELLRTLLSLPDGTLAFRGIEAGFFQLSCGDAVPVVFVCDDAVGYFGIASGDVMFLVHNNDGAKVRYVLDGEKRKYVARDNLVTQASFQLTALQVQGLQLFAHIVANCNGSAGSSRVELWATGQTPAVTVLVQAGKYAAQVLERAAPALAAAAVQRPRSKKRPRPEVALRGERQEDTFSMPGSLAFGASGSLAFGASGSLAFSVPFIGRSPLLPPSRAISPSLEFDGIDFDGLLTDHALSFSLDAQEPPTAEVLVPEVAAEQPAVPMLQDADMRAIHDWLFQSRCTETRLRTVYTVLHMQRVLHAFPPPPPCLLGSPSWNLLVDRVCWQLRRISGAAAHAVFYEALTWALEAPSC